jgi:hypothetical protein
VRPEAHRFELAWETDRTPEGRVGEGEHSPPSLVGGAGRISAPRWPPLPRSDRTSAGWMSPELPRSERRHGPTAAPALPTPRTRSCFGVLLRKGYWTPLTEPRPCAVLLRRTACLPHYRPRGTPACNQSAPFRTGAAARRTFTGAVPGAPPHPAAAFEAHVPGPLSRRVNVFPNTLNRRPTTFAGPLFRESQPGATVVRRIGREADTKTAGRCQAESGRWWHTGSLAPFAKPPVAKLHRCIRIEQCTTRPLYH